MLHSLHSLILSLATFRFSISAPIERGSYYVPAPVGGRPNCARDRLTFCESIEKYPTELIQKLLRYEPSDLLSSVFTDEREGLDEPPAHILRQEFRKSNTETPNSNRRKRSVSHETDYEFPRNSLEMISHGCGVERRFILPKAAENIDGHWRYIIGGRDGEVSKPIRLEICSNSCTEECVQKFSHVRLLSLHPEGNVEEDIFLLPSSCECEDYFDTEQIEHDSFLRN